MAFSPNAGKLAAYRSTAVHSGVDAADPHRLVVMLMDGALERIAAASGLMKHGGGVEKAQLLHRAVAIIDELRNSLNFKAGGAIAANLDALYEYMCQRIMQANASEQARVARRSQPPAGRDPLGLAADCRRHTVRLGAQMSVPASQLRRAVRICAWCAARSRRWRPPNRTAAGVASRPPSSPAPGMSRVTCASSAGAGCTKN